MTAAQDARLDAIEAAPPRIIACRFSTVSFALAANARVVTHAFTAGQCGGTLPDATYVGTLSRLSTCSASIDAIIVANAGEADGPGIRSGRSTGFACTGSAEIAAVYHKSG